MIFDISTFKKKLSVIILAGGKGQRLKPLTKSIPKPLIPLQGKSIIEHIIFNLNKKKLTDIIIAAGYKFKEFNKIKKKVKNNIKIINTGINTDIVKRIYKCLSYCNKYILICYGDTIADVNINLIVKKFIKSKNKSIITSYEMSSSFGVIKSNNKDVVYEFKEKPNLNIWFNIGYILFDKKIILRNKNKSFEQILIKLAKNRNLLNFKHKGKHITVNTFAELEKAKNEIKNIK